MKHLHEKLYELLSEFDEICNKLNLNYSLFGRTACEALELNRIATMDYEVSVAMTIRDYLSFEEYVIKDKKENRSIESMNTNKKFPNLYATYVNDETIFWDPKEAGKIKCPGVRIQIYIMVPFMQSLVRRKILFFLKEGIYIAKNKNFYKYRKKRRIAGKLMSIICLFLNGPITRYSFKYGHKYSDSYKNYYVMECSKKRLFVPKEYIENTGKVLLNENQYNFPIQSTKYITFLGKYYKWRVYEDTLRKIDRRIIVSTEIPYKKYLDSINGNIWISKYGKYKEQIAKSENKQHKNKIVIRKAYWKYLRTIDYYKLENYYSLKIDFIFNKWKKKDIKVLDKELRFYLQVVSKYKKLNLAIGYRKGLHNLVIKYVAYKGDFVLAEYLLKTRTNAYEYIKKMEKINKRNKEGNYDQ